MDALLQGVVLVLLIVVINPQDADSSWRIALSYLVFLVVWFGYNELLRRILVRRAARAEAHCQELPQGVYSALSKQCLPDHFDVMIALAAVAIFSDDYSPDLFSFLPAAVSPHAWIVALVALYVLTYFLLYLPILRERVRNTYYRCMYERVKTVESSISVL